VQFLLAAVEMAELQMIKALDLAERDWPLIGGTALPAKCLMEPEDVAPLQVRTIRNAFQYLPLEESRQIRLLLIPPGGDDDPISCQLIRVKIPRPGEDEPINCSMYPASSYDWGSTDPEKYHVVVADGKAFTVRKLEYEALSYY
jgi:hypothetical protein